MEGQSDNPKIADFVDVFQGQSDEKWYVHTLSSNGKVILTSEGYDDESYARQVAADTGLPYVDDTDAS